MIPDEATERARAEHVEQQNAEWHDDYPGTESPEPRTKVAAVICTFCEHPTADHGEYRCGIPTSPGSPICCKCPNKGPRRV